MWQIVWNWLSTHEWLAIWLEGIALILIFVWDRIDAKGEHEERMLQIEITRQQAEAAKLAAQSVMNSERAWVTADLRWAGEMGRIIFSENQIPPHDVTKTTSTSFVLELRNDGRTPAWIETVFAGMEISGSEKQPELPGTEYIGPLSAGKVHKMVLELSCPGKPKMLKSENLCVHITMTYHDIFESRKMVLEFSVDPLTYAIARFEKVKVNFTS